MTSWSRQTRTVCHARLHVLRTYRFNTAEPNRAGPGRTGPDRPDLSRSRPLVVYGTGRRKHGAGAHGTARGEAEDAACAKDGYCDSFEGGGGGVEVVPIRRSIRG